MRKLMMAVATMGSFAFGAAGLAAQQTVPGAASVTIPQVLAIANVGDLTIGSGDFDFSGSNTSQVTGSVTIDTRANVQHAVEVTGADLTSAGGDNLALEVQASGGAWSALSGTAVEALSALGRGAQAGSVINFRTTADISLHSPGEYTGTITYTVVADN